MRVVFLALVLRMKPIYSMYNSTNVDFNLMQIVLLTERNASLRMRNLTRATMRTVTIEGKKRRTATVQTRLKHKSQFKWLIFQLEDMVIRVALMERLVP